MEIISNKTAEGYLEYPLIGVRSCFYMLHPRETYIEKFEDMPAITARAIPPGMIFVLIEMLILIFTGRSHEFRLHSSIVSWTSTAMYEGFSMFFLRGLELTFYQWTYNNYRFFDLPWNNLTTFFIALITVEFCGYWWHRMSHELAIMWSSHELHHSSEDFNLSVAFRNSAAMRFFRWTFYIPLAFLGIPTGVMFTHLLLGSIYNGFIHQHFVPKLSKVIPIFGDILEFIFVTPSHHRVHHASNKYCIDKNYGQYMIIWDRLFGTFVEEKEDEPLVFGTLTQPETYNMANLQISSYVKLWQKVQSMDTIGNKMRALFYGPGWYPGTPRLGDPNDIPDVRGRKKYHPSYPTWLSCYLVVNCFCIFYSYLNMAGRIQDVSKYLQFLNLVYIFCGYAAQGALYDRKRYAAGLELARIVVFVGLCNLFPMLAASKLSTFTAYIQYADLLMWPYIAKYIYNYKSNESSKSTVKQVNGVSSNSNSKSKGLVNGSSNGAIRNKSKKQS